MSLEKRKTAEPSRSANGEGCQDRTKANPVRNGRGLNDAKSALDAFRADLPKMSPKMAESLDPNAVTSWFWAVYPFTLGSYASAKVGQYTTMLEVASEPALDGSLQFAGEHTSSDFLGFMNGGVESGNRAAAALVEVMALQKN